MNFQTLSARNFLNRMCLLLELNNFVYLTDHYFAINLGISVK
ncbi:hypothetical protein LEP1GSC132_0575 [Leptospira kirschneri str. 200803703]|uniref:Uncharacterized protein n=1 Tax=Leptospira kirschneri str. 200802841 TaxID=1193047 RepID=A0A828Y3N7_9LEPT|nr:hypothetical protein LEP1GSC131_0066 [Leptospira kirschneri str. 200802841]EKP06975.1 hypothetical protein LEP1GSC018_1057 [Leptospira kirschneri str. 2008720114]EMJ91211.1 hypothetical protein LEP1GSC198_1713 [Leptospira kirschneri str. JB]EMK07960.1 hypothetical protein LEP1GSC166_4006 [Leptospira kirschneri]EMK14239.1 hypothetical protein LEP1GSC042_3294 [Leptospira kirschneri serovar Bim str. PUO 1247]EMN05916.1 hypothetical protein LEP1GSC046_0068 [Leptospira kirschneri serovar Bim str